MQTVVIGLGNMGAHMAINLHQNNKCVRGFDLNAQAREFVAAHGVEVFDDLIEAVQAADHVLLMLPNGTIVGNVLDQILEHLAPGALIIDSSTIAVEESRAHALRTRTAGHSYIDAPVSGGMVGAQQGTLAFMIGGTEEDFQRVQALLAPLGRSFTHCGEAGSGSIVKLCNNLILGIHQIAVAEAMVIAQRLGVEPTTFEEVVSNSTGACWALHTNCPIPGVVDNAPSNHDFQAGFATDLIIKDLGLALDAAGDANTVVRFGELALDYYKQVSVSGFGAKDFSKVIDHVREL